MQTKILIAFLAIAVFALPAAVPASQPARVQLDALAPPAQLTIEASAFATLIRDVGREAELSIELPQKFTTFEWINQDPFAL